MGPHHGAIEHLHQMSGLAGLRQELEERLDTPDRLSRPVRLWTEENAMLPKLTVVVPGLAAPRLRRVEHLQHDGPIVLCHSRQHGRLPVAGHAPIRRKADSGIPLPDTWSYPSTRLSR
jgi:hypothetical protein